MDIYLKFGDAVILLSQRWDRGRCVWAEAAVFSSWEDAIAAQQSREDIYESLEKLRSLLPG